MLAVWLWHTENKEKRAKCLRTSNDGVQCHVVYTVNEMPQEPDSCLYQLAFGKTGFIHYVVSLKVAEPIHDVK